MSVENQEILLMSLAKKDIPDRYLEILEYFTFSSSSISKCVAKCKNTKTRQLILSNCIKHDCSVNVREIPYLLSPDFLHLAYAHGMLEGVAHSHICKKPGKPSRRLDFILHMIFE